MHGGNLYEAIKAFGIKKEEIIDFSANINPLGLSQQIKDVLIANIDDVINYPDFECNELREELSVYTGMPKNSIITGNGASEMLYLIFDVLKPKKILIPAPCFSEYEKAIKLIGSEIQFYELKEDYNYRLSIPDLLQHISEDTDTILLCNPNNPTSTLIKKEELLGLIDYANNRNINVIIDEAFIELTVGCCDNSVVEYISLYKNLFIIRALTKIFAIPGLRLGYALGNVSVINAMWHRKIPWSVNSFACCLGNVFSLNRDYLQQTASWLALEKEWLYSELLNFSQLKIFKPDTNFILIKILKKDLSASLLKNIIMEKRILIRDASDFKFLNHKFFRIAIKERANNKLLLEALKQILN